ncbi:hypothetical protein CMV_030293 [Castanea mollissima]|uniref:Uncharacterized protein n=1 Tax=Castanea mollissima TaxID=60419 RepID=A0A8J4Q3I4_9ROSI|nr:hypothetical protein CMV_030293 [Castanea mollissima]
MKPSPKSTPKHKHKHQKWVSDRGLGLGTCIGGELRKKDVGTASTSTSVAATTDQLFDATATVNSLFICSIFFIEELTSVKIRSSEESVEKKVRTVVQPGMAEMKRHTNIDRISNLPWDVLDTILVHIPLKEAVRTSILSSPIKSWWPNKGIKELILKEFDSIKRFKLPSEVFSCPQLSCLELYGCIIMLSPTFRGLNSLISLNLSHIYISSDTLENLIVNCPVLERLTLINIDHSTVFRISNLNLKYLKIDSKFEDICLKNVPLLSTVDIRLRVNPQHSDQGKACNLARVIGCLYSINKLILSSNFLEFLAYNDVPERLPALLNHLLTLDLRDARLDSPKVVKVLLSILCSSPSLEELIISVSPLCRFSFLDFQRAHCLVDLYFNKLKVVKIRGLLSTNPECEFIKFILAHSPVLETITIVTYGREIIPNSVLLQFEPASEHVKVISLRS